MMLLEVDIQNFREVVILDGAGQQDFQCVTKQVHGVMIGHEPRILLEDVACFRIFDVCFQTNQAVLAGLLEHVVEYLQQLGVRGGTKRIRLEQANCLLHHALQHLWRVCCDHGAQTSATNDHELVDLQQHSQLSVMHHVAADNGSKDDNQSDDYEHAWIPSSRGERLK